MRLELVAAFSAGAVAAAVAIQLIPSKKRDTSNCDVSQTVPGAKQAKADPFDPSPRANYLNWDDYFMNVAFLSAQRSKDPNKQVGACIVGPDNVILGIGYNGFPRGCSDAKLPWAKKSKREDELDTKYPYVCHAEMNAVMNKNQSSICGSTMYVTMFPCNECSKIMIQAGIKEVVYFEAKHLDPLCHPCNEPGNLARQISAVLPTYKASVRLLDLAGIRLRQHRPSRRVKMEHG